MATLAPTVTPSIEIRRHADLAPWTYEALDRYQRKCADQVRVGFPGTILLSELSPVITLGKRVAHTDSELTLSREELADLGIGVYPTDRGGLATYHGPGQWVVFVVDFIDRLTGDRRGVRRAVDGLLEAAHRAGSLFRDDLEIRDGNQAGVWSPQGKVASVGVKFSQGVMLHGLSVNGYATEESFIGLKPCGMEPRVDFLIQGSDSKVREAEFVRLQEALLNQVLQIFWREPSV